MDVNQIIKEFKEYTYEYRDVDNLTKGYVIEGSKPGTVVFLLLTTNPREDDNSYNQQQTGIMDLLEGVPEIESCILYDDEEQLDRVAREHDAVEVDYLQEA